MILEVRALPHTAGPAGICDYAIYFMLRSQHLTFFHELGRVSPVATTDWPGRHLTPWVSGRWE